MTKPLMKRQAPRKKESYWPVAYFSRAWGSGPVRQLRRRCLGGLGLHFRLRPTLALGSIDGGGTAAGGIAGAVAVGEGSTAGARAAEVHGSTAGSRLYLQHICVAQEVYQSLRF